MTDSSEPPNAAAADWLVFACPHCENPLKIRAGQTGHRFLCPSCQQEVAAPGTTGGDSFPVPSAGLAVDRLSNAAFRSTGDPALAIPDEGIRVRKRKRRSRNPRPGIDTPEWEADHSDEGGAGNPAADALEDTSSATVKQEVREDGSVIEHRRRTTRRRLPAFVEKSWGVLSRVGSLSLITLGLFVLVGAAVAGWYLARSKPPVIEQVVEKEAFPEPFYPTMDEGAAAAEVVRQFLEADTVEEKLPLVRFPEKVKPLMDLWYKGRPDKSIRASRDEQAESLTKFLHIDGIKFIVVTMLTEPDGKYKLYAVESSPSDGLKVDWETAVGWQAMTVEEFIKGKPTSPQPFRVEAAPGDYYNGPYSDESKWCAVDLSYPGNPDFTLYGYVERGTPEGGRLMQMLGYQETRTPSGEPKWELIQATRRPLILAIAYLREGSDPKQVTIHEVLHEQWFLRDGPAVGNARKSAANQ